MNRATRRAEKDAREMVSRLACVVPRTLAKRERAQRLAEIRAAVACVAIVCAALVACFYVATN